MASTFMFAERRANALSALANVTGALAERFGLTLPDLVLAREAEYAEVDRIEWFNAVLLLVLAASDQPPATPAPPVDDRPPVEEVPPIELVADEAPPAEILADDAQPPAEVPVTDTPPVEDVPPVKAKGKAK